MAGVDYQQTDNASGNFLTALCSSATFDATVSRDATVGGTPGTTPASTNISGSAVNHTGGIWFRITPAAGVTWDAGTWTVNVNVTTANMNLTLQTCSICRVNGISNRATIGEATALGLSLGSTGVLTISVSGSATTPAAGDSVIVLFGVDNASKNGAAFSVTPDQLVSSPFTAAASVSITPAVGALAFTGIAPAISRIIPAVGALALAGVAPSVVSGTIKTPTVGVLALSGVAPSPVRGTILTPTVGSLAAAGVAPSLVRGTVITPTVGALTGTGVAPTLVTGGSAIKTINGLAKASVKAVEGLAIASVKTWGGLA